MNTGTSAPFERAAAGLAALAHPARLAILCHLSRERECCCREVVEQFDLAQSTISQHLKVLVDADLIRCKVAGGRSHYAVNGQAVSRLAGEIQSLLAGCCAGEPAT